LKQKITSSLISLTLLITILTALTTPVNSQTTKIIWSDELQLLYDPSVTVWDPELKKNVTVTIPDWDGLPAITPTSDGKLWITWQTDATGNDDIFYKYYTHATSTWSQDNQLTTDPQTDFGPTITQTADNKIWIFWSSNKIGNNEIYYKTTTDNGANWSTETTLTTDPKEDDNPSAFQTKDGRLWVVWTRMINSTNYDLYYKTFSGGSWSSETQLTTHVKREQTPAITQTADNKIWVFWSSDKTAPYWQIFYKTSTTNGASWSSDTQLTTEARDSVDPTVFQALDGTIWVFWSAAVLVNAEYKFDIFYKKSTDNGATWSSSTQFTTYTGEDLWPTATQAKDKSIYVVWTSDRNENVDFYYRQSLLGDINNDGTINIVDLQTIAKALGTNTSWPWGTGWDQYNPQCDLNIDNKIDISDLFIAAKSYGKTAP